MKTLKRKNLNQDLLMIETINDLCYRNRTIVFAPPAYSLKKVNEVLPLKIHKFPTENNYATWPVPPQWDIVETYLLLRRL